MVSTIGKKTRVNAVKIQTKRAYRCMKSLVLTSYQQMEAIGEGFEARSYLTEREMLGRVKNLSKASEHGSFGPCLSAKGFEMS